MTREPEDQPRRRPTGRRGGDSGTREDILDAALELFADQGYDGASMRAIAKQANVDPALIRHFFGDKNTLFATAVADRSTIPARLISQFQGDPETVGMRIADAYLMLWEDPETQPILMALVRSAVSSESAAAMLREIFSVKGEDVATDPKRTEQIALAASQLFGIALIRYVLRLPAIADLDHDALVALIAPAVQRHLDT